MTFHLFLSTVFNQRTLYDAYKKRTKNVNVDLEEYNRMKESDPEFYRGASSLQYGKVTICLFLRYMGLRGMLMSSVSVLVGPKGLR